MDSLRQGRKRKWSISSFSGILWVSTELQVRMKQMIVGLSSSMAGHRGYTNVKRRMRASFGSPISLIAGQNMKGSMA
jgi:hypothetical protein